MRRRWDWQLVLVCLMVVSLFLFMLVIATAIEDREEQRLRELEQPSLECLEDSVHFYEDGL